jgi:hypothetical protein
MMNVDNDTTDATLTEHLSAIDNTDPTIDGPAKLTRKKTAGRWHTVDGHKLDDDPDEYRVECSCGETFGNWGAAERHAEEEH